jgi:hypothetical protein
MLRNLLKVLISTLLVAGFSLQARADDGTAKRKEVLAKVEIALQKTMREHARLEANYQRTLQNVAAWEARGKRCPDSALLPGIRRDLDEIAAVLEQLERLRSTLL